MSHRIHRCLPIILAAALALAAGAAALHAQEVNTSSKLLADKSPAMVVIKFVLSMKMGSEGEQQNEMEVPGTMISPEGLVVSSNTRLGGFVSLFGRYFGRELSAKPTDIKVLAGDDNQGAEAEFVARDTELDLAWIRIKKPGEKKYAYLDLGKGTRPAIGDPIFCLDKMDKYFDRIAIVSEGRIAGITRKPRELYVPTTGSVTDVGVPVFARSGEVVGLAVVQLPDDEEGGANRMSMTSRLSNLASMGMILPASEVAKATKRALETASTRPSDENQATTKPAAVKKTKAKPDKTKQADDASKEDK